MQIKASTALRNEYLKISELAHASGEPVYITNKGEADLKCSPSQGQIHLTHGGSMLSGYSPVVM